MSRFHPTRASPPIPLSSFGSVTSNETTVILPQELQNLSPTDIDCLDSIVRRAGPNATSFLPIFKAYSEVLKERGLDSQEVVYYGKLLKLGTMKGGNFLDKWEMVKATQQHSTMLIGDTEASDVTISQTPVQSIAKDSALTRLARLQEIRRANTKPQPEVKGTQSAPTNRSALTRRARQDQPQPRSTTRATAPAKNISAKPLASASPFASSDDERGSASTRPPSYKTALATPMTLKHREGISRKLDQVEMPLLFKQNNNDRPQAPTRKPVDPNEAWKNIEMEKNEEEADSFRANVLLLRYWGIWRHGYNWIITTNEQMGKARDKVVLDLFMRRWRQRLASRIDQHSALLKKFNQQRMLAIMSIWRTKLRQKQQESWRNEMRRKMKVVKSKTDMRIQREAWHTWARLLIVKDAERYYQRELAKRCYLRWKQKYANITSLQSVSHAFTEKIELKTQQQFWIMWKRAVTLRRDEVELTRRTNRRLFAKYFDAWRGRMELGAVADSFRDKAIQRQAIVVWKRARNHNQFLEQKVCKHLARQDDILLRAIIRIWRARMRGLSLEKLRDATTLKRYLTIWKFALEKQRTRQVQAEIFANRNEDRRAMFAIKVWQEALHRHRASLDLAEQYYNAHLLAKSTLVWRTRLRDHIQNMKRAKWAQKRFATRRAWRIWTAATEERKRQELLTVWNRGITQKIFNRWRGLTAEKQYFEGCELALRHKIDRRIVSDALTKWTNRVIDLKSRELDVAVSYDRGMMRAAMDKWKGALNRRMEDRSLLDNYLILKDRDLLAKVFRLWLTKQRVAEQRREEHELKERQMRETLMLTAWEKWRERYKEEVLRPLEYEHIFRSQRATQMKAFVTWHSKTKTLPAIHFHAQKTRERFYKKWKDAMPKVLKIKKAKEVDMRNTLARFFEKWKQEHKTKLTLKAVARAKYLRLPPSSRVQTVHTPVIRSSRPIHSGLAPRGGISRTRPPPSDQLDDSEIDDKTEHTLLPSPNLLFPPSRHQSSGARWATRRDRNESRSPVRSEYASSFTPTGGVRQSSPVRSIASMPDRRIGRSRASSRAESVVSSSRVPATGAREDRLWSAIKEFGQSRTKGA